MKVSTILFARFSLKIYSVTKERTQHLSYNFSALTGVLYAGFNVRKEAVSGIWYRDFTVKQKTTCVWSRIHQKKKKKITGTWNTDFPVCIDSTP